MKVGYPGLWQCPNVVIYNNSGYLTATSWVTSTELGLYPLQSQAPEWCSLLGAFPGWQENTKSAFQGQRGWGLQGLSQRSKCELGKAFRPQPARNSQASFTPLAKPWHEKRPWVRELKERGLFSKACSLEKKGDAGWWVEARLWRALPSILKVSLCHHQEPLKEWVKTWLCPLDRSFCWVYTPGVSKFSVKNQILNIWGFAGCSLSQLLNSTVIV